MIVYTIGTSNRSIEEFIEILALYQVKKGYGCLVVKFCRKMAGRWGQVNIYPDQVNGHLRDK